jgi:protein-disulfide isomerase
MAKRKRRKLTKAQARAEAQRRKRQRQIMWTVAGVVAVAVVAVLILIAISGGENSELVTPEPLRSDIETGVTAEGYPYRGSADAPVTIVELSDYNCPVCADFNLTTASLIDDELVAPGDVKYVVHPFALYSESVPIVEAALCAKEQGSGFWNFHHLLFANQQRFSRQQPPSRALLREIADASGLDVDQFQACLDEGRTAEAEAATRQGKEELGVNSTPTFFVNGVQTQLLRDEAYIDTLRKAVEAAKAAGSSE